MLIFNIILYLCRYLTAIEIQLVLIFRDTLCQYHSVSTISPYGCWDIAHMGYRWTLSKCMPIFPCLEIGYTSGPEKEYRGNSRCNGRYHQQHPMTENGTHHGIRWQNEGNTNHGKPSADSDIMRFSHHMWPKEKTIDDLDAEHPKKNVRATQSHHVVPSRITLSIPLIDLWHCRKWSLGETEKPLCQPRFR